MTKVTPLLDRPLDFNARTDLVPVSVLALFSQILVCSRSVGVQSVPDLVRRAGERPLIYASGGVGSPGHLATEMFLLHAGAKMKHVPYRGPTPAAAAVASDEVDCGFLAATAVLPLVHTGQLKALAVSSATPSSLVADVPTLATSLDQPTLDISFRLLLLAPKDTPATVLTALERAASGIMKKPAVRKQLQNLALTPQGSTMKEATASMQAEILHWEVLVIK